MTELEREARDKMLMRRALIAEWALKEIAGLHSNKPEPYHEIAQKALGQTRAAYQEFITKYPPPQ